MKKLMINFMSLLLLFSFISAGAQEKKQKTKDIKIDIQRITGEITGIDTTQSTITIKQEDGSEITLKALLVSQQEDLKKFNIGEKVRAIYFKDKDNTCVLIQVIKIFDDKEKRKEKRNK